MTVTRDAGFSEIENGPKAGSNGGQMTVNSLPPADRLAISDKPTLMLEHPPNGNFKVNSNSLDGEKTILANEVLEIRWFEGRLRITRKGRLPDAGDPPRLPRAGSRRPSYRGKRSAPPSSMAAL